MNNSKILLVVIDPTVLRDHVVERAKLLATSSNAKVELFINCHGIDGQKVYFAPNSAKPSDLNKGGLEDCLLDAIKAEFSELGIVLTTHLCDLKNVAQSIIDRANGLAPDLVLKSTHKHSALKQTLLTNTDWQLIRSCPAPLLLVKPQAWYKAGNIVAAVDPLHSKSDQFKLNDALIGAAENLAHEANQIPSVFHAYYPPNSAAVGMLPETAQNNEQKKQRNQKMYELLAKHSIDPEQVNIARGDVHRELLSHLEGTHSNVLVIGALSRNRLERLVVGSTAEKILDSAPCDLLVLKKGSG